MYRDTNVKLTKKQRKITSSVNGTAICVEQIITFQKSVLSIDDMNVSFQNDWIIIP